MHLNRIKLSVFLFVCLTLFGLFLGWMYSNHDITDEEKAEKSTNDWFFKQRAFPHGEINYDAYKVAYKQAHAMEKEDETRKYTANWNFAGPLNLGGRLSAVAMHPTELSTIYVGAASGGIFKSINDGTSWTPIFDEAMSLSIGDIEIAPSNPDVLYVGTGESNAGGGSLAYDGFGVYRSSDGGGSWEHLGLEEIGSVGRVMIHPQDEDVVFVAAMGRLFSNNPDRGIFRTTDGGASWEKVLYISDSTGGIDLVMDPGNPEVLYAAMWERIRKPDRRQYGGPTSGIYKTTDGGDSWTELTIGLPNTNIGRIGIDISASDPNILYAIYADSIGYFAGVYKTFDHGDTWIQTNDASLSNMYVSYGWWFGRIHIDPTNPDIVYPIGFDLYKTSNGGSSWSNISATVHVDQHDLVAHTLEHEKLFLGNDGGLYISNNGGGSWVHLENLPIMQFYTCEVDESFPERLYGGAQDMGTNRTMTGNTDDWYRIYGGDGFYVLVDPLDNTYVYAEYQYGGLARSTNGGNSFTAATTGISPSDRKNWKCPVIFDPVDPSILYFGSNKLYRSDNRAVSWEAISPDLSNGPGAYNLLYGTITAIAATPDDRDYIYCGTDDGNVWVSTNAGSNWTKISDDLPLRWVTNMAVDPYDAERAFVCFSGYRYDSYQPHVFMTEDAGTSWTDISTGLPEAPVNDIIVDPSIDSCLYVGTDFGVYVSWDYGENWNTLGAALPNVPVVDLRLHDTQRKLIAATYGRSMYTFDLDAIVGIEDVSAFSCSIQVYPNPVSDVMNIQLACEESGKVRIESYDATGRISRLLYVGFLDKGSNKISIAVRSGDLSPGLNIIKISTHKQVIHKKVLAVR
ncbi:MAG: T9SS type A sorting domain-containing protein [Bacteroidetes bacterium]|nr:T9SS type A sorting domain-containing protein [Bacteroidota bacterium]